MGQHDVPRVVQHRYLQLRRQAPTGQGLSPAEGTAHLALDPEVLSDVHQHTSQVFLGEFSGPRILSVGDQCTAVDEGDLDYARAAGPDVLRARTSRDGDSEDMSKTVNPLF